MGLEQRSSGSYQSARANAEQTAPVSARRSRSRRRNELPKLRGSYFQVSLAGLAAVFLLVSVGVAALGRETHPEGTIPPGVFIAGADVGEMTDDEARSTLEQHLDEYTRNPLTLTWDEQQWQPSLEDLGARFDLDASIEAARFTESRLERMQTRVFGPNRTDIPLRLHLDEDQLEQYVADVAGEINREPEVPALETGDSGLSLAPARNGLETDRAQVIQSIRDSLYSMDTASIEVPVEETEPDVTDVDVAGVREMVEDSLEGPITLWFQDQSWTIEQDQLFDFLTLQKDDQGEIELGFEEGLIAHLDQLVGDIDRPPQNAEIAWGGESVVATSPSQDGIERDLEATIPRLEEAVVRGEQEVELAYNVIKPAIDSNNLGELGIDGVMAQGESAFWNSAASRANNIGVAAGYLDGTVVPPGAEFSFNNSIGEISTERGYEEGYVIQAEETVPGIGGGVCQVSTTAFRAAFFSGLPITERNPHAYLVGFYEEGGWPVGFDAAIFQPSTDFRFLNTTDSYLLIHTHVADQTLYVNIYGPDLGYQVELGEAVVENRTEPPDDVEVLDESLAPGERRQVEQAKPGMEVTLPRTVTDSNGEVIRQDYFYSNFQAWGNRFLVGPSPDIEAEDPEDAPEPDDPSGEIIEEEVEQEQEPDQQEEAVEGEDEGTTPGQDDTGEDNQNGETPEN